MSTAASLEEFLQLLILVNLGNRCDLLSVPLLVQLGWQEEEVPRCHQPEHPKAGGAGQDSEEPHTSSALRICFHGF